MAVDTSANSGNSFFLSAISQTIRLGISASDRPHCWMRWDNRRQTRALYDTGAVCSFLSPATFALARQAGRVGPRLSLTKPVTILTANGSRESVNQIYVVSFELGNRTLRAPFLVAPFLPMDALIGMNVIKKYGLGLDASSGSFFFANTPPSDSSPSTIDHFPVAAASEELPVAPVSVQGDWETATAVVQQKVYLPPFTGGLFRCSATLPDNTQVTGSSDFVVTINDCPTLVTLQDDGHFWTNIRNASPHYLEIPAGTAVGTCTNPLECSFVQVSSDNVYDMWREWHNSAAAEVAASSTTQHSKDEDYRFIYNITGAALDAKLNPADQIRLRDLLFKFRDVISSGPFDLGRTTLHTHKISLRDKEPIFTKQFPLKPEEYAKIREDVDEWLRIGIVEPANSPYNSPIFCVKKKDESLRVVLDYRRVNSKAYPDRYSIRAVDECIREVGYAKANIFTTLDLQAGFWQMPLDEACRDFTSFTVPGKGQFRYITSPMGLSGCPASFSRLMDTTMRGLDNVMTYIDDVLIFNDSPTAHLHSLQEALLRLRKAGLKLNLEKCRFGCDKVEYLGHEISGDGVRPSKDKKAALLNYQAPTTLKDLRSFMGLANYFRSFMPNYASVASPLFRLTRKDTGWSGGDMPPDALSAFEKIRDMMTSPPVLAFPNRDGAFHLFVDACTGPFGDNNEEGGLGACLLQDQPGKDTSRKIIGYASRRLLDHERNYPPGLLELAAICYGIDFFDHYLRPNAFKVYTDHKPIADLSKVHRKTYLRFQSVLENFNPEFCYVKGSENAIADFLSRHPTDFVSVNAIDVPLEDMIKLQLADPTLARWSDLCRTGKWDKKWGAKPRGHHLLRRRKGLLVLEDGTRRRTVAPQVLRNQLISHAHDHLLAGHNGRQKTLDRVATEFWWPGIDADVADYVRKCSVCQRNTPAPKPAQLLNPLPLCTGPGQRVHADLWGPQKGADGKPRYVLVMTDAFSKLVALAVIPNKEAETVASAIMDKWIFTFGVPKCLLTDRGLEFNNKVLNALCDQLNISHLSTSGYHPQCNGQAEVFNKSMANYLRKLLDQTHRSTLEWEELVGYLQLSYNTAVHSATKKTPFAIVFGYDPRTSVWPEGIDVFAKDEDNKSMQDHIADHRHQRETTRREATANNQDYQDQYRRQHDKHVDLRAIRHFQPGDLVWISVATPSTANRKLDTLREPGTIIRRLSDTVYEVAREIRRKRIAHVNVDRLSPRFVSGPPPGQEGLLNRALDDPDDPTVAGTPHEHERHHHTRSRRSRHLAAERLLRAQQTSATISELLAAIDIYGPEDNIFLHCLSAPAQQHWLHLTHTVDNDRPLPADVIFATREDMDLLESTIRAWKRDFNADPFICSSAPAPRLPTFAPPAPIDTPAPRPRAVSRELQRLRTSYNPAPEASLALQTGRTTRSRERQQRTTGEQQQTSKAVAGTSNSHITRQAPPQPAPRPPTSWPPPEARPGDETSSPAHPKRAETTSCDSPSFSDCSFTTAPGSEASTPTNTPTLPTPTLPRRPTGPITAEEAAYHRRLCDEAQVYLDGYLNTLRQWECEDRQRQQQQQQPPPPSAKSGPKGAARLLPKLFRQ